MTNRLQIAQDVYHAYASGDRAVVENLLADDFTFYSPPDPGIDRAAYFERCWPNSGNLERFEFVRLIEHGDEVVVTYEATRTDGTRFRNTEVLTFDGEHDLRARRSTSAGTRCGATAAAIRRRRPRSRARRSWRSRPWGRLPSPAASATRSSRTRL